MESEQSSPHRPSYTSEHTTTHHTSAWAEATPELLTPEWVRWLAARLSQCRVDHEPELIIQHKVIDADGNDFCWHVRLENGGVSVNTGMAPDNAAGPPRITLTSDTDTATAIAAGTASPARAFLTGKLRLEGDAQLLLAAQASLQALNQHLNPSS